MCHGDHAFKELLYINKVPPLYDANYNVLFPVTAILKVNYHLFSNCQLVQSRRQIADVRDIQNPSPYTVTVGDCSLASLIENLHFSCKVCALLI